MEATPAEGRTYYVVGAERPPTDFVKFTRATDVIAGGIGILALDGGDGSHFPYPTLMDVGRAAACEPQLAADGVKRCLPAGAAVVYNFTDSLCTKPAAHEIAESCDPIYEAKLARMPDPANLDRAKIYTLGAKRPDLQVYARIDPMTCDGPMMAPSEAVFDIGAEVPAAMFSAIDNEDQGGTRIVSSRPVAAGKRFPKWGPLFDKQLDALCSPSRSSDGKLRCAPQAGLIAYSDDQCSQRIFVRVGGDVPKYALEIGKDCAQTSHLFPVAAEITPAPAMTYQDFTGSCVGEVISDQAEVYSVGAEVDPSTFVEVTEVIR